MDEALRLLLTNAVLAGLLALAAWAVSRLTKRQAVVHGLWLLALLKLVTPPLVELPLLPARGVVTPAPVVLAPDRLPEPLEARSVGGARVAGAPAPSGLLARRREAPAPPRGARPPLRLVLAGLLALGTAAVTILAVLRFGRFRRLAEAAEPAPADLAARAEEIGEALGVRRAPELLLLSARVPPMLWPASPRPKLLLPRDLLPDLDEEERDALLAHELAHVRRLDHWVRFLEVGATAVFWWYPVAWWSRSALRRAEERCCDEWVLRALPGSARAYANGILKTVTFLSEASVPIPETASGAGPTRDLESRLKEILMTTPRPRLSRPIRLVLGVLATGALAVFPTFAPPRSAEAAAASLLPDADATPRAGRAPAAPNAGPPGVAAFAPTSPAAATAPVLAPAPLAAPAPAALPEPASAALGAPIPLADGEEAPDPALEKARRALDAERQRLHLSQIELERRALEVELQAARQEAARAAARRRAEGDAAGAVRAEKAGSLRVRRAELEQRQLDLQAKQVRLEIEMERAAEDGVSEKDAEARARAAERAEAELEKQQQALEAESGKLEREMNALEAEERVLELRGATDDLARSLAEQVAGLREALAEAGPEKGALEGDIARLEAALAALRGPAPGRAAPKAAGR